MKKIIAAFDGLKFSSSTRDHAIELAKLNNAHLVGVFLEDFTYHSYRIYELIREDGGGMDTKRKHLDKRDSKKRATAIFHFEEACRQAGISFAVHKDRNIAIRELLKESIYADLLVIDSSETFTHHQENIPTKFIHELLPHVQCPVLVVPREYRPFDKLVLLFDGEPSSVHAVKMLTYTLPHVKQYPAEVVTVNTPKQPLHVPDKRLMNEFMKRHYPSTEYTILKGLPEMEITSYLKKQKGNPLVVLGAYRRGMVSRWMRASLADALIKELKQPLFIAHNK